MSNSDRFNNPSPGYTLYGKIGSASAIVEAMLSAVDATFKVDDLNEFEIQSPALVEMDGFGKIPILRLLNGDHLSHPAAISFHLGAGKNGNRLIPGSDSSAYTRFLKMFFVLNEKIYPLFPADAPTKWRHPNRNIAHENEAELQKRFEFGQAWSRLEYWQNLYLKEAKDLDRRWTLGEHFSVIDIYLAVMIGWGVGKEIQEKRIPHLAQIAHRAQHYSPLKSVFERHRLI